jgi:hypothetical protein
MAEIIGQGLPPAVLRRVFQREETMHEAISSSRAFNIDMGRIALIDSHRVLMGYGDDPKVVKKYERDYAAIKRALSPEELDEARAQAFEFILKERGEQ